MIGTQNRNVFAICILAMVQSSIANSIDWNVSTLDNYREYEGGLYSDISVPRISVYGTWSDGSLVLQVLAEGNQLYASTCIQVEEGTEITADLVASGDARGFFYKSEAVYGTAFSDYDLMMQRGETLYLGYLTYQVDSPYHPTTDTATYIGWLALNLSDEGHLQILSSAKRSQDGALVAGYQPGSIPEPNSLLLALLGGGFVVLRRNRCRQQGGAPILRREQRSKRVTSFSFPA